MGLGLRLAATAVVLAAACEPAPALVGQGPSAPVPAPTPAPAPAPAPTPTPAPASASAQAPSPPPRRPGAYANVDPTDDYVVGPPDALADCDDQLAKAGVTYKPATLPVHTDRKAKITCGAPQVVLYVRGPGAIAYDPPPLLTCTMALALASFEHIVQDEAERIYHSPVARIGQLGTYSCRVIAAYRDTVSEHSYANAIDVARFTLKNGVAISVMSDFDKGADAPKHPGGTFLRTVSQRANDEQVFSHVLTPFFDVAHRDHFHLDLARFTQDGTRPES
jgi:hypothetical protein